ncbi:lipoprotein [Azospira sp. I13]|uniref:septal ring lytic transglycosylase RlpA family protein n=1 Tax=Azospira sp. I13 TaxID=1765050 RepID=UPI000D435685|nr:septal ring lytic transglycosylase RlpA family protein [Azospira sp. I13]GBG03270.1 lipoprotein [Azospira sp. I13]
MIASPGLRSLCSISLLALLTLLGACGSPPPRVERSPEAPAPKTGKPAMKPNPLAKRGGGFYKDDGLPEEIPENIDDIPDADPRWEPLHRFANKPYVVLGKEYVPQTRVQPYKVRGIGSWYGKKFHGQKTSIGEPYDMFAMTAAHPTLAIPSYVRVTNVQNGRSVVVRVTDRGPFHADRVIDLSFTAAYKLGYVSSGSTAVEVESIVVEPGGTYAAAPAREVAAVVVQRRENAARNEARPEAPRNEPRPEPRNEAAAAGDDRDPILTLAMTSQLRDEVAPIAAGGVFLQLGAFSSPDNAESLKAKLARELDWVSAGFLIHSKDNIHRLQLGPYRNRQDADKEAERIRLALGFKPTFVTR